MVPQDNSAFLWIVDNKDYNIDLSIDDLVAIYYEKKWEYPSAPGEVLGQDLSNTSDIVEASLARLNPRELAIMRYVNQAIMNIIIKHESLRNAILSGLGREDIFWVILDDRNEFLVQNILARPEENIIVLYGLMHFSGVFELLQEQDSKWQITNTQDFRVIW
jgi:hypothetical protein